MSRQRPRVAVVALLVAGALVPAFAPQRRGPGAKQDGETVQLAGLQCSLWKPPPAAGRAPLVVFSHGFHGNRNQSTFLTAALARAGYFVVAPNHRDAMERGSRATAIEPQLPFRDAAAWNDGTFRDRADDVRAVVTALAADARFSPSIDATRIALAGHSLGGYTVLGLAGAWPSWRMAGVKAVLALSPYASPFLAHGDLAHLAVPVMYQTGTADLGIAPFLRRPGGAYDQSKGPAYLVELQGAGHLAWADLNPKFHAVVVDASVAFLDRYVKGDTRADPARRGPLVADLRAK
jgi:predicted dienelactone hydrolase